LGLGPLFFSSLTFFSGPPLPYPLSYKSQFGWLPSLSLSYTVKMSMIFPFPAGMSLTKLSLAGNKLIIPGRESLISDIQATDGKNDNLF
jgi:hypothetical protein